MNYLVTGGAGFIGSKIIKQLLTNGHNVLSVDRKPHCIEGATCCVMSLKQLIDSSLDDKVDVVIHAAARINVQESFFQFAAYYTDNVELTKLVAERWKDKVIFLSSCAVDDIQSPYALTKKLGEQHVTRHGGRVVRLYNVYGPGSKGVVETWIQEARNGRPLKVNGSGNQIRSFIHVDTVVDILSRLQPPSLGGPSDVYPLGGPATHLNYLAEMIQAEAKQAGKEISIEHGPEVDEIETSTAPICLEEPKVLEEYIRGALTK